MGEGVSANPSVQSLIEALGPFRPAKARLSAALQYAEWEPDSANRGSSRLDPRRIEAEAAIVREAEANPSPGAIHALGILQFLKGNTEEAIRLFEQAAEDRPRDAALWTDLAAAYLANADSGHPRDYLRALECARKANQIQPSDAAALFNQALAMEGWLLRSEAADTWKAYLRCEKDPNWLDEGRRRLASVSEQVDPEGDGKPALEEIARRGSEEALAEAVRADPQTAREQTGLELLSEWARSAAANDSVESARLVSRLQVLGQALLDHTGDALLLDAATAIERADPTAREALIQGQQAFQRGLDDYRRLDENQAEPEFRQARTLLRRGQSPIALLAEFQVQLCRYQGYQYEEGLRVLPALGADQSARYPGFAANKLRLLGLIQLITGQPTASLSNYLRALEISESMGERRNVAHTCRLVSENYTLLGRRPEGWDYLHRSLENSFSDWSPRSKRSFFQLAALTAAEEGSYQTALSLQRESLHWSQAGDVQDRVGALAGLATIELKLGLDREASAHLKEAELHIKTIPSPDIRRTYQLDHLLLEARVELEKNPSKAARLASEGIAGYRKTSFAARLGNAFFLRSEARSRLGDPAGAEADLAAAIDWVEKIREKVGLGLSISFLDDSQTFYDRMIERQFQSGRGAAAFEYAERARARELLDRFADASDRPAAEAAAGRPLALDALRGAIAPDQRLIGYRLLEDRLLIWVVSREGVDSAEVSVSRHDLELMARRFLDRRQDPEAMRESGVQLQTLLIAPIDRFLEGASKLVFLPDRALHMVPFSALCDGRGRPLVADFQVAVAPSASVWAVLRENSAQRGKSSLRALAVADPAFDGALFPGLPRLPAASAEAAAVEKAYPGSRIVAGSQATPERFLALAPGFQVIHLASHALPNAAVPLNASLVMAPGPDDTGTLTARRLYDLKLPATELVVLAACSTSGGAISESEGAVSLARPFFAAGVPNVVATLWEIDDNASSALMEAFHKHFAQTRNAPAALRAAQLEMMKSDRYGSPGSWGAFEVLGGG